MYLLLPIAMLLAFQLHASKGRAAASVNTIRSEVEREMGLSIQQIAQGALESKKYSQQRKFLLASSRNYGLSKYLDDLRAHFDDVMRECEAGGVSKSRCESNESDQKARVVFLQKVRDAVESAPEKDTHEAVALAVMSLQYRLDTALLPKFRAWRKRCENNESIKTPPCQTELSQMTMIKEMLTKVETLVVARVTGEQTKILEDKVLSLIDEK